MPHFDASTPRLYDLPKLHEPQNALRLHVSFFSSPTH